MIKKGKKETEEKKDTKKKTTRKKKVEDIRYDDIISKEEDIESEDEDYGMEGFRNYGEFGLELGYDEDEDYEDDEDVEEKYWTKEQLDAYIDSLRKRAEERNNGLYYAEDCEDEEDYDEEEDDEIVDPKDLMDEYEKDNRPNTLIAARIVNLLTDDEISNMIIGKKNTSITHYKHEFGKMWLILDTCVEMFKMTIRCSLEDNMVLGRTKTGIMGAPDMMGAPGEYENIISLNTALRSLDPFHDVPRYIAVPVLAIIPDGENYMYTDKKHINDVYTMIHSHIASGRGVYLFVDKLWKLTGFYNRDNIEDTVYPITENVSIVRGSVIDRVDLHTEPRIISFSNIKDMGIYIDKIPMDKNPHVRYFETVNGDIINPITGKKVKIVEE